MSRFDPSNEAALLQSADAVLPLSGAAGLQPDSDEAGNVLLLSDQLRSAQSIQRALLPQRLPTLTGWSFSGGCRSSGPIGGDFFDAISLSCGAKMLVVADVMGKGIPAALIASVTRTVTRMAAQGATGPGEALARVNELLYEDLSSADMFVTAQVAWIDPHARTLRLASAGHCPMLWRDISGTVHSLCPSGIPVGVAQKASYSEEVFDMEDLQLGVLYSDGVTDTRNSKGEMFGEERLRSWIQNQSQITSAAEPLKESLFEQLDAFQGRARQKDDQTVLVLCRAGS